MVGHQHISMNQNSEPFRQFTHQLQEVFPVPVFKVNRLPVYPSAGYVVPAALHVYP